MGPILESLGRLPLSTSEKVFFLRPIIDEMRDMDWDTLDECLGIDPAFDKIYGKIYGVPDDELRELVRSRQDQDQDQDDDAEDPE